MDDYKYLVFDTETTGLNPATSHILTCYMRTSTGSDRAWLLDPGVEVPKEASDVHGITTEYIRQHGRKDYVEAISEIIDTLHNFSLDGGVLVAFNAPFDFGMLLHAANRQGITFMDPRETLVIDPHVIDKAVGIIRKGRRTLTATAQHYGIVVDETQTHAADYDVHLTEQLIVPTLNLAWLKTPELKVLRDRLEIVRALQPLQASWKISDARRLEAYFAKQGKVNEDGTPIVVDKDFPWRALDASDA